MNLNNLFTTIAANMRHTIIMVLVALCANSLYAQNASTIAALGFNGKSASTVSITIMAPGAGGNKSQANVGDRITSGTKMIIPAKTMVVLQSPGGKQLIKSTNPNNALQYTFEITAKGENHTIEGVGGFIESTVNHAVGYNYKVNNGKGTTAASKGTVFTFTDYSEGTNERATIKTIEGVINVIDEVPVSISGQNNNGGELTKSSSKTLSADDEEFTSSNEKLVFTGAAEAIPFFEAELKRESDPEERAENLVCLGMLYVNNYRPAEALKPYREAIQYYENEYGADDQSTIEAKILLAIALVDLDKKQEANDIVNSVLPILLTQWDDLMEDYKYLKDQEADDEDMKLICDDLWDVNWNIVGAYNTVGNEAKAHEYGQYLTNNDCK